jgi:predicted kinase
MCKRLNQKLVIIKTVCSEETIKQRINERRIHDKNVSDADFDIYKEYKGRFEPLNLDHLVINTEQELSLSLLEVKKNLEAI